MLMESLYGIVDVFDHDSVGRFYTCGIGKSQWRGCSDYLGYQPRFFEDLSQDGL